MANSQHTNIDTKKTIKENLIFHNLYMYNKKNMPIYYGLVRTSGTGKIPNSSFFYPKTE